MRTSGASRTAKHTNMQSWVVLLIKLSLLLVVARMQGLSELTIHRHYHLI